MDHLRDQQRRQDRAKWVYRVCLAYTILASLVWLNELSGAWVGLAILLAVVNPLVELVSPRGTDDFTMATTNALICLGFGVVMFG